MLQELASRTARHAVEMPLGPGRPKPKRRGEFCLGRWVARFGILLFAISILTPSRTHAGNLSEVTATPTNDAAGAGTTYTISFTVEDILPANGKIVLTFPPEFNVEFAQTAMNVNHLDGGFSVSVSGQEVTVTRDGTGTPLPEDSTGSFKISVIFNHFSADDYPLTVVTQQSDGSLIDSGNALITIVPASLHHVKVLNNTSGNTAVAGETVSVNQMLTVHAGGFDAYDNYRGDVAVNWSVIGNIGSVAPNANVVSTVFTATTIGSGVIRADHPTAGILDGDSNPITVTAGALDHIKLRTAGNGLGEEFGAYTMTTDDSVTIYAAGYDVAENYLGEVAVGWSSTGTLALFPPPPSSQSFYTFSPKVAPRSGTIVGTHATAGSDATGTITVNPGKPFGTVVLTASKQALPADGTSSSRIISGAIQDAEGNAVGQGKLFTLSVNNPAFGSIDTTDADPMTPGRQIGTDNNSRLSFKFKAGTTGGAASIFVASTNSSATGSVNISVNELKILRIETTPVTVTQGQQNIPVRMIVQNIGVDNVTITNASLTFVNDPTGYVVTPPSPLPVIAGNASLDTLIFSVNVKTDAATGLRNIDGTIAGTLPGNTPISDAMAASTDSWTVQTPPNVSYIDNSLSPALVSTGNFYEFSIRVRNLGQATVELNPATTTFEFGGGLFQAKLDADHNIKIPPGDTLLVFQRQQIPLNMPVGTHIPTVTLNGMQNGIAYQKALNLPVNTGALVVGERPPLEIVAITAGTNDNITQVTQGMTKRWPLLIEVKNNTSAAVVLDSTDLKFIQLGSGNGLDSLYRFTKPDVFLNSQDDTLAAGDSDFLGFQIDTTGQKTGTVAIFAKVFVKELPNPAESNGTQKSILVQTPAQLQIALKASQATVTQNQTTPWQVTMTVTNLGESQARVIFADDSTNTTLSNESGYRLTRPSGIFTIPGNDAIDLVFTVTQTGSRLGAIPIHGRLWARELNSDVPRFADTNEGGSDTVIVQTPANVFIQSTYLTQVFNGDTVNTRQHFQVRVTVQNTGEERMDSVWVKLDAFGNSSIADSIFSLHNLAEPAIFDVTADSEEVTEIFTARIDSARSSNTKANLWPNQIGQPNDNIANAIIQKPAILRIDSVQTSEDTVRVARTLPPWYVYVAVTNTGSAPLVLDPSQVITIRIGSQVQPDYTIEDSLKNQGIVLRAGQKDTLVYKVTRTGNTGGLATIAVTVRGRDKNSNATLSATKSTTIVVETTSLVRITRTTFPTAVNRLQGTDIALVDTAQTFQVNVTVENNGFEPVQNAWVSLMTEGASQIFTAQTTTGRIENFATALVAFNVRAANIPDSLGEKMTAQIDSAKTASSFARINRALDDSAVVRIQLPARLQLSVSTNDADNALRIDQPFEVRARVSNLGQAQIDNSGRLQIALPTSNGYRLADGEQAEKSLAVGVVKWNVIAPNQQSLQDAIVVRMTQRPRNKNTGSLAETVNTSAQVVVSTFQSTLGIQSIEVADPPGAVDRVLSTDQFFTVVAKIRASANLTNKSATLTLPPGAGYRLRSGENATKFVTADSVSWEIQAPSQEQLSPAELTIEVQGLDGQNAIVRQGTLSISSVEKRAILQLQPGISQPPGARDGVLSTSQDFTIIATLRNTGRATTYDTAIVKLDLGETGITTTAALEKTVVIQPGSYVATAEWQAKAPDTPREPRALTFVVTRRPLDTNTNRPVTTSNDPALFEVTTVDGGSLSAGMFRIIAPEGAKDGVLSTGQDFTVSLTMNWSNATNVTARLQLPPSFVPLDDVLKNFTSVGNTGNAEPSWRVRAPAQPITSADLQVQLQGVDAHDNTRSLNFYSPTVPVRVVQRAELELDAFISSPPTAMDGIVSAGQTFEVAADIQNVGAASIYDTAQVRLNLPVGYSLVDAQEPVTKTLVGSPYIFTWRVRASSKDTTEILRFTLVKKPRDENSDDLAAINDNQDDISVRTESKKLVVQKIETSRKAPAIRGEKGLASLRLRLTNSGDAGSSNIVLNALHFALRNRQNHDVPPNTALAAIRVVKDRNHGLVIGRIDAPVASNPVTMNFAAPLVVTPLAPDTIAILIDIQENATAENFYLAFDREQDFTVLDQDSGTVVVVEDDGGRRGQDFQINSDLIVLFASEPQQSFSNFPNPFRPGRNSVTYFTYNLPEASDGELKIYTLLGELVWQTAFSAIDRAGLAGFHRDDLFWDGRNGEKKEVLNGVYVALLKTKYGVFQTKVAVVK